MFYGRRRRDLLEGNCRKELRERLSQFALGLDDLRFCECDLGQIWIPNESVRGYRYAFPTYRP